MKFKKALEGLTKGRTMSYPGLSGYIYLDKSDNPQLFTFNVIDYENFNATFNSILAEDWSYETQTIDNLFEEGLDGI